ATQEVRPGESARPRKAPERIIPSAIVVRAKALPLRSKSCDSETLHVELAAKAAGESRIVTSYPKRAKACQA
ncbi:MAG TPA: hypothetical protein PKX99_04205, partial [Thermoanaerobaculia bacterium]|nr:hypothetical protein [Thermoanaerobaculia bacterium]